jgi:hypothetical protein
MDIGIWKEVIRLVNEAGSVLRGISYPCYHPRFGFPLSPEHNLVVDQFPGINVSSWISEELSAVRCLVPELRVAGIRTVLFPWVEKLYKASPIFHAFKNTASAVLRIRD